MNIAAVFIAYSGIKETQFHLDTSVWRGQYATFLSYKIPFSSFPPFINGVEGLVYRDNG